MHWILGIAALWVLIEAARYLRAKRKEHEFVRRSLAPGAGLTHGLPKQSLWDFIKFG